VIFLSSVISDPKVFLVLLILFGLLLVAGVYFRYRKRIREMTEVPESAVLRDPASQGEQPDSGKPAPTQSAFTATAALQAPLKPEFAILQRRPLALADLLRALLIVVSLAVAAALILTVLPQPSIDRLAQRFLARHGASQPEKIAFLYLGDDLKDGSFRIRGVIRNISTVPIEQLDAAIRLYAHDRSILETTVVRMSKETIDPGDIAQFELVYPDYRQEFGSYSVEFKLRQGDILPYKDMRANRAARY
jgi:hypothetical protein